MMLYEHGLRDRNYLCELAARLAHQKYVVRHDMTAMHANSNDAEGTFS